MILRRKRSSAKLIKSLTRRIPRSARSRQSVYEKFTVTVRLPSDYASFPRVKTKSLSPASSIFSTTFRRQFFFFLNSVFPGPVYVYKQRGLANIVRPDWIRAMRLVQARRERRISGEIVVRLTGACDARKSSKCILPPSNVKSFQTESFWFAGRVSVAKKKK